MYIKLENGNENVSNILYSAFVNHESIDFIKECSYMDELEAYKTQDLLINKLKKINGSSIIGYKISMTSSDTQSIAKTKEPAYGTILSNNVIQSGESISLTSLFEPLIEPEIMFILMDDISSNPSEEEILSKVKIAPGIEIPDSRYKKWFPNFKLSDLLVDNTATGFIVLGEAINPLNYKDLGNINMSLLFNNNIKCIGNSSEVLGNPINAVKWLAQKLAIHNKKLLKGQIISSGTFISPMFIQKGTYKAVYNGIGSVKVTFSD